MIDPSQLENIDFEKLMSLLGNDSFSSITNNIYYNENKNNIESSILDKQCYGFDSLENNIKNISGEDNGIVKLSFSNDSKFYNHEGNISDDIINKAKQDGYDFIAVKNNNQTEYIVLNESKVTSKTFMTKEEAIAEYNAVQAKYKELIQMLMNSNNQNNKKTHSSLSKEQIEKIYDQLKKFGLITDDDKLTYKELLAGAKDLQKIDESLKSNSSDDFNIDPGYLANSINRLSDIDIATAYTSLEEVAQILNTNTFELGNAETVNTAITYFNDVLKHGGINNESSPGLIGGYINKLQNLKRTLQAMNPFYDIFEQQSELQNIEEFGNDLKLTDLEKTQRVSDITNKIYQAKQELEKQREIHIQSTKQKRHEQLLEARDNVLWDSNTNGINTVKTPEQLMLEKTRLDYLNKLYESAVKIDAYYTNVSYSGIYKKYADDEEISNDELSFLLNHNAENTFNLFSYKIYNDQKDLGTAEAAWYQEALGTNKDFAEKDKGYRMLTMDSLAQNKEPFNDWQQRFWDTNKEFWDESCKEEYAVAEKAFVGLKYNPNVTSGTRVVQNGDNSETYSFYTCYMDENGNIVSKAAYDEEQKKLIQEANKYAELRAMNGKATGKKMLQYDEVTAEKEIRTSAKITKVDVYTPYDLLDKNNQYHVAVNSNYNANYYNDAFNTEQTNLTQSLEELETSIDKLSTFLYSYSISSAEYNKCSASYDRDLDRKIGSCEDQLKNIDYYYAYYSDNKEDSIKIINDHVEKIKLLKSQLHERQSNEEKLSTLWDKYDDNINYYTNINYNFNLSAVMDKPEFQWTAADYDFALVLFPQNELRKKQFINQTKIIENREESKEISEKVEKSSFMYILEYIGYAAVGDHARAAATLRAREEDEDLKRSKNLSQEILDLEQENIELSIDMKLLKKRFSDYNEVLEKSKVKKMKIEEVWDDSGDDGSLRYVISFYSDEEMTQKVTVSDTEAAIYMTQFYPNFDFRFKTVSIVDEKGRSNKNSVRKVKKLMKSMGNLEEASDLAQITIYDYNKDIAALTTANLSSDELTERLKNAMDTFNQSTMEMVDWGNKKEGLETAAKWLGNADSWWITRSFYNGVNQWWNGMKNIFGDADGIVSANDYACMYYVDGLGTMFGSLTQSASEIITSIGNMAPSIAIQVAAYVITYVCPPAGATMSFLLKNASAISMGLSAAGNATEQGLQSGMSMQEALIYGALTGTSEAVLEKILGGIIGISSPTNIETMAFQKIFGKLTDNALFAFAKDMFSEGLEEGVQEMLDPLFKRIASGGRIKEDIDWDNVAKSALYGAITAGVMNGFNKGISYTGKAAFETLSYLTTNTRTGLSTLLAINAKGGFASNFEAFKANFKALTEARKNGSMKLVLEQIKTDAKAKSEYDAYVQDYNSKKSEYKNMKDSEKLLEELGKKQTFDEFCESLAIKYVVEFSRITNPAVDTTQAVPSIETQTAPEIESPAGEEIAPIPEVELPIIEETAPSTDTETIENKQGRKLTDIFDEINQLEISQLNDYLSQLTPAELKNFVESLSDNTIEQLKSIGIDPKLLESSINADENIKNEFNNVKDNPELLKDYLFKISKRYGHSGYMTKFFEFSGSIEAFTKMIGICAENNLLSMGDLINIMKTLTSMEKAYLLKNVSMQYIEQLIEVSAINMDAFEQTILLDRICESGNIEELASKLFNGFIISVYDDTIVKYFNSENGLKISQYIYDGRTLNSIYRDLFRIDGPTANEWLSNLKPMQQYLLKDAALNRYSSKTDVTSIIEASIYQLMTEKGMSITNAIAAVQQCINSGDYSSLGINNSAIKILNDNGQERLSNELNAIIADYSQGLSTAKDAASKKIYAYMRLNNIGFNDIVDIMQVPVDSNTNVNYLAMYTAFNDIMNDFRGFSLDSSTAMEYLDQVKSKDLTNLDNLLQYYDMTLKYQDKIVALLRLANYVDISQRAKVIDMLRKISGIKITDAMVDATLENQKTKNIETYNRLLEMKEAGTLQDYILLTYVCNEITDIATTTEDYKGVKILYKGTNTTELEISAILLKDIIDRLPEKLRLQLKEVVLLDGFDPTDVVAKYKYRGFENSPFFSAGASDGSIITLIPTVFDFGTLVHEIGHNIDSTLGSQDSGWWTNSESEWSNAKKADMELSGEESVTEYGKQSLREDFAESLKLYIKDAEDFRKKFPNRARILEEIVFSKLPGELDLTKLKEAKPSTNENTTNVTTSEENETGDLNDIYDLFNQSLNEVLSLESLMSDFKAMLAETADAVISKFKNGIEKISVAMDKITDLGVKGAKYMVDSLTKFKNELTDSLKTLSKDVASKVQSVISAITALIEKINSKEKIEMFDPNEEIGPNEEYFEDIYTVIRNIEVNTGKNGALILAEYMLTGNLDLIPSKYVNFINGLSPDILLDYFEKNNLTWALDQAQNDLNNQVNNTALDEANIRDKQILDIEDLIQDLANERASNFYSAYVRRGTEPFDVLPTREMLYNRYSNSNNVRMTYWTGNEMDLTNETGAFLNIWIGKRKRTPLHNSYKIYIPYNASNFGTVTAEVFDYLVNNNIASDNKIAKNSRADGIVLRIYDLQDALKVIDFINNNPNIESNAQGIPLAKRIGKVSVAMDGNMSYNSVASDMLQAYLRTTSNPSYTGFANFINQTIRDINIHGNLQTVYNVMGIPKAESLANFMEILNLLKLSLSEDGSAEEFFSYCLSNQSEENVSKQIRFYEELLVNDGTMDSTISRVINGMGILYPNRKDVGFLSVAAYILDGKIEHVATEYRDVIRGISRDTLYNYYVNNGYESFINDAKDILQSGKVNTGNSQSEFNAQELKSEILASIDITQSKESILRQAYMALNRRVHYDPNYNEAEYHNKSNVTKDIYNGKNMSFSSMTDNNVICKNWSFLYRELLIELGFDSNDIKIVGNDNVGSHRWIEVDLHDGRILIADGTENIGGDASDVFRSRYSNKTHGFVITSSENSGKRLHNNLELVAEGMKISNELDNEINSEFYSAVNEFESEYMSNNLLKDSSINADNLMSKIENLKIYEGMDGLEAYYYFSMLSDHYGDLRNASGEVILEEPHFRYRKTDAGIEYIVRVGINGSNGTKYLYYSSDLGKIIVNQSENGNFMLNVGWSW